MGEGVSGILCQAPAEPSLWGTRLGEGLLLPISSLLGPAPSTTDTLYPKPCLCQPSPEPHGTVPSLADTRRGRSRSPSLNSWEVM